VTSSADRFDAIRAAHPGLGFCVYALENPGLVTFEMHLPDGRYFSFKAATLRDALALAFPPDAVPQYIAADHAPKPAPEPKAPQADIFD